MVQWLRLCAPNTGGMGLIPGQGTGELSCPPRHRTHTRIEPYSDFCFPLCPHHILGADGPPKPSAGTEAVCGWLLSLCPSRSTLLPDVDGSPQYALCSLYSSWTWAMGSSSRGLEGRMRTRSRSLNCSLPPWEVSSTGCLPWWMGDGLKVVCSSQLSFLSCNPVGWGRGGVSSEPINLGSFYLLRFSPVYTLHLCYLILYKETLPIFLEFECQSPREQTILQPTLAENRISMLNRQYSVKILTSAAIFTPGWESPSSPEGGCAGVLPLIGERHGTNSSLTPCLQPADSIPRLKWGSEGTDQSHLNWFCYNRVLHPLAQQG